MSTRRDTVPPPSWWPRSVVRFLGEETGQDVIEYALLAGAIGIVGVVAWNNIAEGIGFAYQGWDTGVQNLWEPADPGAGS